MDAVLLGLAPTRIALLLLLLLLSLPACPQEREGLRQQVRSVEDKCREFQEALQCKICRAVSAACAVFRERDMGGWVGLPQLHGLPCLWRCGMIHPPAPLICLPCLLCARPNTPPPPYTQLYNFSRTPRWGDECEEHADLLPPGTHLALVDPYLRYPKDDPTTGPPCVRCDNPQAVRILRTAEQLERARKGSLDHEVCAALFECVNVRSAQQTIECTVQT